MTPTAAPDWIAVAKERISDAQAIADNRDQSVGCIYMAGYAIECSLKGLLQKQGKSFPKYGEDGHNLQTYLQARDEAVTAQAAAQQAIAEKNDALSELVDDMKSSLRYAENTVDYEDVQLKLLGWGGRKSRTAQQAPGQCRSLEAPRQGEGWVFLDWKEPAEGGTILAYKVQSRLQGTDPWQDIGTALDSEIALVSQPRGSSLEYRVIAINKVGSGDPSNTVSVVL